MESREIPNEAVKASSSWGSGLEPWQARLNNIGRSGSWSAHKNAIGEYLQIDLGKERVVNKIATQGRASANQWVTSYNLLFSSDGANWNEYQNNGVVKVKCCESDSFSCCVGHHSNSRTCGLSTGSNYNCFLLRHEELTGHRLKYTKGSWVGWLLPMQMTVMRCSFATEGAR